MSAVTQLHQNRPAGVVVSNVRRIGKGALVSIFDAEIPAWHLLIKECKLFRKEDREWICLPSSPWTNKDGKTIYKDLIEFNDPEAFKRFQAACLADLK